MENSQNYLKKIEALNDEIKNLKDKVVKVNLDLQLLEIHYTNYLRTEKYEVEQKIIEYIESVMFKISLEKLKLDLRISLN